MFWSGEKWMNNCCDRIDNWYSGNDDTTWTPKDYCASNRPQEITFSKGLYVLGFENTYKRPQKQTHADIPRAFESYT